MANHLIIGLGGTGGAVLCSLRKRIYEEFRSNDPMGDTHVEYLYVDSDLADLHNEKDWQISGTSVQLSLAQRLSINEISNSILNNLDQYPSINAFINSKDKEMLKEDIDTIISKGIGGQHRRFGRMLMACNMCGLPQNTFVGRIHSRVSALKEKENVDDVTFHICAGLGGGTGSGAIIDAVAQIRNEFQRTQDDRTKYKIQLYLYVPEEIIQIPGGEDNNRYYQSNGYAALLELNAMSVGRYFPTDVKGNTDEYGNVRRLLKGQDAFDVAYLYTNVNEAGKEIDLKVLSDIAGSFLFLHITNSSMKKRITRQIEYDGLSPEENNLREAVHSRKFMTFGVKRIEYPEREVVEYAAYNFARQVSMQMLYGWWDEARGYIECTEDMVGKYYVYDIDRDTEKEANLLADDYLMLSKPLPSIEKHVTNWKPIVQEWEFHIDRYKQDVQAECQKKEWYEEFNQLCEKFFDSMYRGCGVKRFYAEYETQIPDFAEEICRRIENNLFANWKNGNMSIIEVHKYINVLINRCGQRIEEFKYKIDKQTTYLSGDLADQLEDIYRQWINISWLKNAITNVSSKTLERLAVAKREQLTVMTNISAYGYAVKLLSEVTSMLTLLNANSVEPFMRVLNDFADTMKKQAEEKCKLSDAEMDKMNGEVVKEYDPKLVHDTVQGFLKNPIYHLDNVAALRASIVESAGSANVGFSNLGKKINVDTLTEITLKACIEDAQREMNDYSTNNPNQRLVNVNILDKLRNSDCNTPDKRKQFVKELHNTSQSLLLFNGSEEGKVSPRIAAYHWKFIHLLLPLSEEDNGFRDDFIKDFGTSSKIPLNKEYDITVNPRNNQMVVVTIHGGFPLRHVDNVRVLKEKYDILTQNEVNRMVVHTESFSNPLPTLFFKNDKEAEEDLIPIILLAYTIDGIIVDREDIETGEKIKAFAGEKNKMGRISRWIRVENDMVTTLKEFSKEISAIDAATLKRIIVQELNTNYKNTENKKLLIQRLNETLNYKLLPLVENDKSNPIFIAFNAATKKLCDNEFKIE